MLLLNIDSRRAFQSLEYDFSSGGSTVAVVASKLFSPLL